MKPSELYSYFEKINKESALLELTTFIEKIFNEEPNVPTKDDFKESFVELILKARETLSFLSLDKEIRTILDSSGMQSAFDYRRITKLVSAFDQAESIGQIISNVKTMTDLTNLYTRCKMFIRYQKILAETILRNQMKDNNKEGIIVFDVIENQDGEIRLDRFVEILKSFSELYLNTSSAITKEAMPLKVKYIESGSSIKIKFQGDFKIINKIEKLFVTIWDKIKFTKLDEFDRTMESIKKGFDVLELIADGEKKGKLSEDEAKRLKHCIFKEIGSIFSNGAMPDSIPISESLDNRQLLSQKTLPKMLKEGRNDEAK